MQLTFLSRDVLGEHDTLEAGQTDTMDDISSNREENLHQFMPY
jgi:hypothetical protein